MHICEAPSPRGSVVLSGARYTLSWRADGVARVATGWMVETELGYAVAVRRGYLASFGVALFRKDRAETWLPTPGPLATDGWGEAASRIAHSLVEDVTLFEDVHYGSRTFDRTAYGKSQYVMAGAVKRARNEPDDPVMTGLSLYIEGEVTSPAGGKRWFLATTSWSTATTQGIEAAPFEGRAEVRIVRNPGAWFDGIDFDAFADDEELGKALLHQIRRTTVIETTKSTSA